MEKKSLFDKMAEQRAKFTSLRLIDGDMSMEKKEFLRLAKLVLRGVARQFKIDKTEYDLRIIKSGPASLGEVSLHTNDIYVQIGEMHILIRSCEGRKDYTGGVNHLIDYNEFDFINTFRYTYALAKL